MFFQGSIWKTCCVEYAIFIPIIGQRKQGASGEQHPLVSLKSFLSGVYAGVISSNLGTRLSSCFIPQSSVPTSILLKGMPTGEKGRGNERKTPAIIICCQTCPVKHPCKDDTHKQRSALSCIAQHVWLHSTVSGSEWNRKHRLLPLRTLTYVIV